MGTLAAIAALNSRNEVPLNVIFRGIFLGVCQGVQNYVLPIAASKSSVNTATSILQSKIENWHNPFCIRLDQRGKTHRLVREIIKSQNIFLRLNLLNLSPALLLKSLTKRLEQP